MSFVRTILGDIPLQQIGITYSHEHIVIDQSFTTEKYPEFLLNDKTKILTELKEIKKLGVSLMVDTMPSNAGRNPYLSAELSRESEIFIIVPTGIHLEKYYPENHWRYALSEDEISDLFIEDITLGIDKFDYNNLDEIQRSPHKAGLIKLATGDFSISDHQEKIFRAVVNAHLQTGAPILTHTNNGTLALEQVERFIKLGADINHVVISHMDKNKDINYLKELLNSGVSVEFDSAFRWKSDVENNTYRLLEELLPDYHHQITVGMDAAKNIYWKSYGGKPGLDYLMTKFIEELKIRDLDQYIDHLFISNPKRIFSFMDNDNT